jgi:ABC-type nitrate/sulfonate/bicarbonate transport system substrate-binding protein
MHVFTRSLLVTVAWFSLAHADHLRVGKSEPKGFDFAILDVGIAKGFYQKRGLDIDVYGFAGGAKEMAALAAGAIDIDLGAGAEMASIAKGVPAKAVAAMAGPPLNMCLVVLPGGFSKPEDIKGRSIGISTAASLTDAMATYFSRDMGWGLDGMKHVALGNVDAELAGLFAKNVDSAVIDTEEGYHLQGMGRIKVLTLFGTVIPVFLTHAIFASNDLIAKNPDSIKRFLAGWFETVRWMQANRAEAIALSQKVTLLPDDIAGRIYDEQMKAMYYTDGHFPPAVIDAMRQLFLDLHMLPSVPPNGDLYTEEFLSKE